MFDSSTADSSVTPSANGVPRENMVTPTPSRTRTTEDLFAAIHRYRDAFSLLLPISAPLHSGSPASLRFLCHSFFSPSYTIISFCFSLHLPPPSPRQHRLPPFTRSHKPQHITLNSKLFIPPLYPSTHHFSLPLLLLHSASRT